MRILAIILGFLASVTILNPAKAVFIKFEENEEKISRNITVSFSEEINDERYRRIDDVDAARTEIENFIEPLFKKREASVNVCFEDISTQQHVIDLDNRYIYDLSEIENPRDNSFGPPKFVRISIEFNYTGEELARAKDILKEFKRSQTAKEEEHKKRLKNEYY